MTDTENTPPAGRPFGGGWWQAQWARVRPSKDTAGAWWLASILATLGYFKLLYTPTLYHPASDPSFDGSYYLEIARHVRDGRGLVTNVSLMHKGYETFPHPTSVYPLWPLLLGYAARVAPIQYLAVWLPVLFYFLGLAGAYLLGRRLAPRPFFPEQAPGLNAGHVFVLVFGLHRQFFTHTSHPYTEALAYALLLLGSARLCQTLPRGGWRAGLESGAWLGLAFLARGQLIIAAPAALLTIGLGAAMDRERRLAHLQHALLATAVIVGFAAAHYMYIESFVLDPGPRSLFRFDQNRATDLLPAVPMLVHTDSFREYLIDRAGGFSVAWSLLDRHGFNRAFYGFQYALPLACVMLLIRGVQHWRATGEGPRSWLSRRPNLPWTYALLLASAGYLHLHHIHKGVYSEWNFATRQALTCGFAFAIALCALVASRNRLVVTLGILLLTGPTLLGLQAIGVATDKIGRRRYRKPYRGALARWLNLRTSEAGDMTVAMHGPHKLSLYTPRVSYHSVVKGFTSIADLERLVDDRGIRYVILPRSVHRWRWRGGGTLNDRFQLINSVSGLLVYMPRRTLIRPTERDLQEQEQGPEIPSAETDRTPPAGSEATDRNEAAPGRDNAATEEETP